MFALFFNIALNVNTLRYMYCVYIPIVTLFEYINTLPYTYEVFGEEVNPLVNGRSFVKGRIRYRVKAASSQHVIINFVLISMGSPQGFERTRGNTSSEWSPSLRLMQTQTTRIKLILFTMTPHQRKSFLVEETRVEAYASVRVS